MSLENTSVPNGHLSGRDFKQLYVEVGWLSICYIEAERLSADESTIDCLVTDGNGDRFLTRANAGSTRSVKRP